MRAQHLIAAIVIAGAATTSGFAQNLVQNGGFEADPVPAFPGYGPITGWTADGASGINDQSGPFMDNSFIPEGSKVAFLQGGGTLSQNVPGFVAGQSYRFRMRANSRAQLGGVPSAVASVSVNGVEIIPPTDVGFRFSEPFLLLEGTFTSTGSGSFPLVITSTGSEPGDFSLLLDTVSIVPDGQPDPFTLNAPPPSIPFSKWIAARTNGLPEPPGFVAAWYQDGTGFPYGFVDGTGGEGGVGRNRMIALDEQGNVYHYDGRHRAASRLFRQNIDADPGTVAADVILTGDQVLAAITPTVPQSIADQLNAVGGGVRGGYLDPSGQHLFVIGGAWGDDYGVTLSSPEWILRHNLSTGVTNVVAAASGLVDIVVDDQFVYGVFIDDAIANFGGSNFETDGIDMLARIPVGTVNGQRSDFTVMADKAALASVFGVADPATTLIAKTPEGDLLVHCAWARKIVKVQNPKSASPAFSVLIDTPVLDSSGVGYVRATGMGVSSAGQIAISDDGNNTLGGTLPGERGIVVFDAEGNLLGAHLNAAISSALGVNFSFRNYLLGMNDNGTALEQRGGPTNNLQVRSDGLMAIGLGSQAGAVGRNSTFVMRSSLVQDASASVHDWHLME